MQEEDIFHSESLISQGTVDKIVDELSADPELVFVSKKRKKPTKKKNNVLKSSLFEEQDIQEDDDNNNLSKKKKTTKKQNKEEDSIFESESTQVAKDKEQKKKRVRKNIKEKLEWDHFKVPNHCQLIQNENYLLYITEHGISGDCDIIGIDVGYTHLALVAIKLFKTEWRITHIAMLTVPKDDKGIHFCLDKMIHLFLLDKNFSWILKANKINIEQQMQTNPSARCLSFGLRGFFHTLLLLTKRQFDVFFVSAIAKYKVAATNCKHCLDNPLRQVKLKGDKGRKQRKQISTEDFICWSKTHNFESISSFLSFGIENGHQVHDFADAFFIALYREFFSQK